MTDRFNDHAHVAVPTQRRLPAVRIGATSAVWIIAMSTFQTGVVLAQGMAVGPLIAAAAIGMVSMAPMPCGASSRPAVNVDSPRTPMKAPTNAPVASTSAAAPSLIPLALPAVTEPSFLKAGRRFCIASIVAPARIYSS